MVPFDQGGGESPQDDRTARLQHQELARVVGNLPPMPDVGQTIAVQVYDGGSIPTSGDKYFLGHPVYYGSDQCEGCPVDPVADTRISIPFVVLGSDIPKVGDVVHAHSAGGRWVAQLGVSQPGPDCLMATCGSCNIPKTDLTVAWTNPILGDGSTTLAYSNGTWTSGCSNELIYQLSCTSNQVEFRAIYFISARCPDGTRQYCSNLRANPHGLTQTKLVCGNDFELDLDCGDACPILQTNGFTSFKVTCPSTAGQPPPSCRVCFTVTTCGPDAVTPGNVFVPGATVTISGGTGPGGTGTTDSNGFVAIDIGEHNGYTVTITKAGFETRTFTDTFSKCGIFRTYEITPIWPDTLTLSWKDLSFKGIPDACLGASGSATLSRRSGPPGGTWGLCDHSLCDDPADGRTLKRGLNAVVGSFDPGTNTVNPGYGCCWGFSALIFRDTDENPCVITLVGLRYGYLGSCQSQTLTERAESSVLPPISLTWHAPGGNWTGGSFTLESS